MSSVKCSNTEYILFFVKQMFPKIILLQQEALVGYFCNWTRKRPSEYVSVGHIFSKI